MIIKQSKSFEPAPEGVHHGVCVDVTPLKTVETQYGPKQKFRIVFELAEKMKDGRPYTIGVSCTPSVHEKSRLRKIVKSWRGADMTAKELSDGFDPEKLIGVSAQIVVSHTEKEGEVYSNIETVLRPTSKVQPSGKYVRVKDREENKQPQTKTVAAEELDPINDDLDMAANDKSCPF